MVNQSLLQIGSLVPNYSKQYQIVLWSLAIGWSSVRSCPVAPLGAVSFRWLGLFSGSTSEFLNVL